MPRLTLPVNRGFFISDADVGTFNFKFGENAAFGAQAGTLAYRSMAADTRRHDVSVKEGTAKYVTATVKFGRRISAKKRNVLCCSEGRRRRGSSSR